jgi:peptidoglycan hydrolase-like protein with peptidoglycan-binding domain
MTQAAADTDRAVAHPTIKKGSRGEAVELAQNRLNMRFYEPGPIDGKFGAKTAKAVRWYQRDRNLDDDGVVGPRTWARLDPPTIRRGGSGDAVRLCQRILEDFDYEPFDPGKVDGDFGPDTERAVKRFQDDFGLEVDGVVGPVTWAMLGS